MKALLPWIMLLAAACRAPSRREAFPPPPARPVSPSKPPASPASRPAPPAASQRGVFYLSIQGDPSPLPCKVKEWKGDSLVVEMKRSLFSLAARGESPGKPFPDALLPKGGRVIWRCRILKESGGVLTLAFPQSQVAGVTRGKAPIASRKKKEPGTGGFWGIVLWGRHPLEGARVRAVQLTGRSLLPGILEAPPKLDHAVETRTDREGRFTFRGLPPGNYKIWIQPRGRKDWIRRIRMVPDVRVLEGKMVRMKPFRVRVVLGG